MSSNPNVDQKYNGVQIKLARDTVVAGAFAGATNNQDHDSLHGPEA